MTMAAIYHAIYRTLWRLNERHDLRSVRKPANDNPWRPVGAA